MTNQTDSRNLVSELNFCVIDLETTGGNQSRDQIIEIGMVKIKNLEICDEKSFLINPKMDIPSFIQKLTSIKDSDVKDAPIIDDVIDEILEFIGDDIIVAHNISFDLPFLNSVLKRLGKEELKNRNLCTNVMTKHMIPDITSSNLSYMSNIFGIEHSNAHRAKDDAIATAKLLLKFIDIFIEKDIQKINHLYYPRNKFELDRLHFDDTTSNQEIIDLMKKHECPMTITLKGEVGLILGVIPIEDINQDEKEIKTILDAIGWKRLTLKLTHPLMEGFFLLNSHFQKLSDNARDLIIDFLDNKYKTDENSVRCDQLDFVITNHLIKNQVCLFSFLNLSPKVKATFKIPAQKKKLYNQMKSLSNRFEQKLKGKRTINLHKDVARVFESYLNTKKSTDQILFLSRKQIKDSEEGVSELLAEFIKHKELKYSFPENHL